MYEGSGVRVTSRWNDVAAAALRDVDDMDRYIRFRTRHSALVVLEYIVGVHVDGSYFKQVIDNLPQRLVSTD